MRTAILGSGLASGSCFPDRVACKESQNACPVRPPTNRGLYRACSGLPDTQRKKKKSPGLLRPRPRHPQPYHGRPPRMASPVRWLGGAVYLWEARVSEDARVEAFAAGLDAGYLNGKICCTNNEGKSTRIPSSSWRRTSPTTRRTTGGGPTTYRRRPTSRRRCWICTA
jgi:hypothetical protein